MDFTLIVELVQRYAFRLEWPNSEVSKRAKDWPWLQIEKIFASLWTIFADLGILDVLDNLDALVILDALDILDVHTKKKEATLTCDLFRLEN